MLKIPEFCKIRDVTLYRLAKAAKIKESTLRKRADVLGWEASFEDGILKLRSPKSGAIYTYEGVEL